MFIYFLPYTGEGQYAPSFALEVKSVNFHGATNDGWLIDLDHIDDEQERILVCAKPYGNFEVGEHKRISSFSIVEYPATRIITKLEFHELCGKGRFLNAQGHFFSQTG